MSDAQKQEKPKVVRKDYKVKAERHTHNGREVLKDGTIDITEKQAEFLRKQNVI